MIIGQPSSVPTTICKTLQVLSEVLFLNRRGLQVSTTPTPLDRIQRLNLDLNEKGYTVIFITVIRMTSPHKTVYTDR